MIVKCPACEAEYDCTPGKYQCDCGTKFYVAEDGTTSTSKPVAAESRSPETADSDKTIPPQTVSTDTTGSRNSAFDPEKTVPGIRIRGGADDPADDATIPGRRERKPDGRFAPGDVIMGRYEVLAELGQGGMGVVYKCFDKTAGIEIALKALPPELSHNTIEMEDIRDNFQLVAKLVHQNIAISKNLERDNSNGNYYLIMECVEGEDLRRWIKRKRQEGGLKLEDVLPVVKQVAAALDYAHKEGVIHRDIKPGNIMIDRTGNVKVLDFGLAAQIHTSMTRVSMAYHGTSGTGPYMAPEQWRGRAQGAAADQYALAVMTYEMLAGHLPFESTDAAVLREAVLNDTPEPVGGLDKSAQEALTRALSKEPAERFASCTGFVAALAGGKPSWAKVGRDQRKRLVFIAAAVVAVLAVVALITVIAVSVFNGSGGDRNGGTSAQKPLKKLSKMELYELQRRLAGQKDQFMKLDRDADTQTHILEFENFFQIGSDALSHNDFDTASDAFQRAAREAQWLTDNEARRQEEKRRREEENRRREEENRRLAKERRLAEKRRQEKARQEARRQFFSTGVLILPPDVKLELVKVEAGTFTMGSPSNEEGRKDNEAQHQVTLTKDFYIGKTEVTQDQWIAVMDDNPSKWVGGNRPVETVSWDDAMAFCKKLNDSGSAPAGWKFSLPTEAQWEYAARGGNKSRGYKYSGSDNVGEVASYGCTMAFIYCTGYTDPVARLKPNELGLYDMSGNVNEWCLDWYEEDYAADPEFLTGNSGSKYVIRGGSWAGDAKYCRSANRGNATGTGGPLIGFRVVLVQVK